MWSPYQHVRTLQSGVTRVPRMIYQYRSTIWSEKERNEEADPRKIGSWGWNDCKEFEAQNTNVSKKRIYSDRKLRRS